MSNIIHFKENTDVYLEQILKNPSSDLKRPAVIICPGGGYFCVGTTEGAPVAIRFAEEGYVAFVLNYSILKKASFDMEHPEAFAPTNDLSDAINYLLDNSSSLGIDPDNISIAAFSAGGHLALRYCLNQAIKDTTGTKKIKSLILVYPFLDYRYKIKKLNHNSNPESEQMLKSMSRVIFGKYPADEEQLESFSNHSLLKSLDKESIKNLVPIFIYHAKNDSMVPYESSEDIIKILDDKGADYTTYLCDYGEHANPFYDPSWFDKAFTWMS